MITIRRMSLGSGYRYLIESVAAGDGAVEQSSSLTRYYAESGTPPGVFLGAGLAGLADGKGVQAGAEVTEEHLWRMLGMCADPLTGQPVGKLPHRPPATLKGRIERRVAALPWWISDQERQRRVSRIEKEECSKPQRRRQPVAGFDLTFSPSKSVSTAWALADQGTKAVIYQCHRRAIDYVLAWAEREVFHSRSGVNGVLEEEVEGVVAASFTHWDSRSGDPQLHDHVVVLNRARSISDGRWRTLDSRALFKSVVTLGVMHDGVLSDMLTQALGIGWDQQLTRDGMGKLEIDGVPDALMKEFSQRVAAIREHKEQLVADFVAAHGRQPTPIEKTRLAQQANLATRQAKTHRSLADLSEEWRQRALPHIGDDAVAWVSTLRDRNDLPLLRADDFADDMLADAAEIAVQAVAERRSTFSRANVLAEVHRQFHGVRFASPDDRVETVARTADLALHTSMMVTAPELHHTPARFRRPDGTGRFRATGHEIFTHPSILDAEARLLDAGRDHSGPVVPVATVAAVADAPLPGRDHGLSVDQALALEQVATSGRVLDVLVGPAGTGKTTTLAGLRHAWEAEHGPGSVIGLAPSATAAEVLADELAIGTENTAKWLTEWRSIPQLTARRARLATHLVNHPQPASPAASRLRQAVADLDERIADRRPHPGQLVIVDEASLAGTFTLDELVSAARHARAKVLFVGDWAQLGAVDAGGMFRALVHDRDGHAPELSDVRRFQHRWEKTASVELRLGRDDALNAYETHGRISGGNRDEMLDALYSAWRDDRREGKQSLMIAGDLDTVRALNARARADRIQAGEVTADGLTVAGQMTAGVGDLVVTRENNRLLTTSRGWVKNGDRWIVTATHQDGSMTVRRASGRGEVVLPAQYVRGHVELGYATTAHRSQGRTSDTAHALISAATDREALYVAATRGREANRLYVDTCYDPDPSTSHDKTAEQMTAREVLAGVLRNEGADVAAHEMIRRSYHDAESLVRLAAEYNTIARAAQQDRWQALLERSGLNESELEAVRNSEACGPLLAALRDAESRGLDIDDAFPRLVTGRSLNDADDPAAVLHSRVDRWMTGAASRRQHDLHHICGLIPKAQGVTDPDLHQALDDREQAMEHRARTLAETAIQRQPTWVRMLGTPPENPDRRETWFRHIATVAAYRERWSIDDNRSILGGQQTVKSTEQLGQHKRARSAIESALAISRSETQAYTDRGRDIAASTEQRLRPEI